MTGRNYDYLPDDQAALKDEIARLDACVAELEEQVRDLTARLDRRDDYEAEQNERGPT